MTKLHALLAASIVLVAPLAQAENWHDYQPLRSSEASWPRGPSYDVAIRAPFHECHEGSVERRGIRGRLRVGKSRAERSGLTPLLRHVG